MTIDRRAVLGWAVAGFGVAACRRAAPLDGEPAMTTPSTPAAVRMPVAFIGHGSPMNAITDNTWSRGFAAVGAGIPTPAAIVTVSAHWYGPGTWITGNPQPPTIHDFGGFPRELFEIEYPARGDVDLARRISDRLSAHRAALSEDWGLDHGTWSVLRHLRPAADVPVLQVSIDHRLAAADHLAIGRALSPLRDEGVLILGSGNVTHNLRHAFRTMQTGDAATPDWAASFDRDLATALEQRDHDFLARALDRADGKMSHPTPDHYLPLLYAAGATDGDDRVTFPVTGFDLGSLSMRSALFSAS
jgi:4,5-DOPA dioxygenase extradiol